MTSTERIAIDLVNWQNKNHQEIIEDIASFGLEAGKRPWEKRINPVAVSLADFSKLINKDSQNLEDIAALGVYQWASEDLPAVKIWTKSLPPLSKEILDGMLPFADFNPGTVMVWISPPLEGIYKETRMVVYQTIEVNNEKYLFFRAICGDQTETECLKIAQELFFLAQPDKNFSGLVVDLEQLRASPLELMLPKDETFTGFLSKIINMPKVWRAIANGEDLQEKKRALEPAEQIVQRNHQRITHAKTFDEQWEIGIRIERALQEKMGITLQSGACGTLYSNLSRSPLTELLWRGSLNRSLGSGRETSKFIHNCGACGKSLKRYMSKGDCCPYCGGTYEGC